MLKEMKLDAVARSLQEVDLEQAHREGSEKDETVFLKRVLKQFLAAKRPRNVRPVKHTRYVPNALRQQVKAAAEHRCTFRSVSGVRCNQTAHLEIDHIRPWAKGGSSQDIENLRVLCRAHNQLAAKQAFPGRRGLPNRNQPLAREMGQH